jgi:hypothetical protein
MVASAPTFSDARSNHVCQRRVMWLRADRSCELGGLDRRGARHDRRR